MASGDLIQSNACMHMSKKGGHAMLHHTTTGVCPPTRRLTESGVRWAVTLVLSLLTFLSSAECVLPSTALAEDSTHTEYSVLYGGNFSDADAHRFSYKLAYLGPVGTWWGATQSSYYTDERDVNHWDVTNGWAGVDPYAGANQRDILYLSTHGTQNLMAFYDPSYSDDPDREEDQYDRGDNIGPDTGFGGGAYTEMARWEIGSDWTGTNRSISRWDDDIEWVFLAACNQLSSGYDSRVRYARTLLGDPNRAHAIWGYDYSAPGDADDVAIVNEFFEWIGEGTSIRYAWLKANESFGANDACGIVHAAMQYEGLPPVSPLQSDSAVGSTPYINYWYIPSWDYSPQPVADAGSSGSSALAVIADGFMGLFRTGEALAADAPIVLRGANTTYHVEATIPQSVRPAPLLMVSQDAGSAVAVAERVLGGSSDAQMEQSDDGTVTLRKGNRTLVVHESGRYRVFEGFEPKESVQMTVDEAVAEAKQYVREVDSLPSDAEVVGVKGIAYASLNTDTGTLGTETVQAYIVDFGHSFEDVPIMGVFGDKISVTVTNGGVCDYARNWHEVECLKESSKRDLISPNEALAVVATEGERLVGLPEEVRVDEVELVYYSMTTGGCQTVMFPAWRVGLGGSSVYINAVSGRPITE